MKSYLLLASLIAIFVVGGIGMFITIPDTMNSQKNIEIKQSPINSENEIISYRHSIGSEWAIEYEYAQTSFPIEQVEKTILENISSNEKFEISRIEPVSDYQKRFGGSIFTPLQNTDINYTHVVRIKGLWTNHHDLIQETLENIQGIKNVKVIHYWES